MGSLISLIILTCKKNAYINSAFVLFKNYLTDEKRLPKVNRLNP